MEATKKEATSKSSPHQLEIAISLTIEALSSNWKEDGSILTTEKLNGSGWSVNISWRQLFKDGVGGADIYWLGVIGNLLDPNEVNGLLIAPGGGHLHLEGLSGDLLTLLAGKSHHQPLLDSLETELLGKLEGDEAAVGSSIPHHSSLDSGQFNLLEVKQDWDCSMITGIDLGRISDRDTDCRDITVLAAVEELMVRLITEGTIRILEATLLDTGIAFILSMGPRETDTAAIVCLEKVSLGSDSELSPLLAVIESARRNQFLVLTNLCSVTLGLALRTFSPFIPFLLEMRIRGGDYIDSLLGRIQKATSASVSLTTSVTFGFGIVSRFLSNSFEQLLANPGSVSLESILPFG